MVTKWEESQSLTPWGIRDSNSENRWPAVKAFGKKILAIITLKEAITVTMQLRILSWQIQFFRHRDLE